MQKHLNFQTVITTVSFILLVFIMVILGYLIVKNPDLCLFEECKSEEAPTTQVTTPVQENEFVEVAKAAVSTQTQIDTPKETPKEATEITLTEREKEILASSATSLTLQREKNLILSKLAGKQITAPTPAPVQYSDYTLRVLEVPYAANCVASCLSLEIFPEIPFIEMKKMVFRVEPTTADTKLVVTFQNGTLGSSSMNSSSGGHLNSIVYKGNNIWEVHDRVQKSPGDGKPLHFDIFALKGAVITPIYDQWIVKEPNGKLIRVTD